MNIPTELPVEYIGDFSKDPTAEVKLKPFKYYTKHNFKLFEKQSDPTTQASFFGSLCEAFNNKQFCFIGYLLSKLDKDNMVIIKPSNAAKTLNTSTRSIQRYINDLLSSDFLVRVNKNKYMVNPSIIYNFKKTSQNQIQELEDQFNLYRSNVLN